MDARTAGEPPTRSGRPGLSACSLCAGETLGAEDPVEGGQLERLRRLGRDGTARLALVECLDACERGDVVVARPSAAGRAHGGRPVWFERLAGDRATGELGRWLVAGGPGMQPLPPALAPYVIARDAPPSTAVDSEAS